MHQGKVFAYMQVSFDLFNKFWVMTYSRGNRKNTRALRLLIGSKSEIEERYEHQSLKEAEFTYLYNHIK